MKKSLFVLAAVGAFAGAAQAQSSVTVYGLLDYGYQGAGQRMSGPASSTITSGNTVKQMGTTGFQGSGEATSRLGFRGTEDLGGGTRAFFTIEAALNTDTSGVFGSVGTGTAATGNRQTFIGLGQKGIGQASIGIQYTPIHEAASLTDAGGLNNQNGNVIYDRRGGFGASTGQVVAGEGVTGRTASGMSTNTSYTVRTSNALVLKSENFSGFSAKAMLVSGGKVSSVVNETINTTGYGVGLDYTWQKLYVTAAFQSFTTQQNSDGITRDFALGYAGGAITPGTNALDNQQYYAATYDFGVLKAYLQYLDRKVTNINNINNYEKRTAQQIGVRAPLGKNVQVWASGGTGKINNNGNGAPEGSFNGWQLGSDYFLSKRTNLYAIYGQTATSNFKTGASLATSSSTANTSYNAYSYAVGIKTVF